MTVASPGSRFRIAIAGLGTVGAGLVALIEQNHALIEARMSRPIAIVGVSARDRNKPRPFAMARYRWYDDPVAMARDCPCDVVVELIGGEAGIAADIFHAALNAGKPVVTANKALMALHGLAFAKAAEHQHVTIGYEAAVAGAIPVIKTLREAIAGNRIRSVSGILNGTSNFILSAMRKNGRDFADVLVEAQQLGYAEADPSRDIDGIDAAHKLALIASVAFAAPVDFHAVHVEGIRDITPLDIAYAAELGYRIKLLAIAERHEAGLEQRVHATLVPLDHPLAQIEESFNAVMIETDQAGAVLLQGRGAGAGPAASAVMSDLIDIGCGRIIPIFGVPTERLQAIPAVPMSSHSGAYYIRLMLRDQPGVFAAIAAALRDQSISLGAMLQRHRAPDAMVPVVMTTHETSEAALWRAIEAIHRIDAVYQPPMVIRIMAEA